jgi:hypothetical protein
MVVELLEQHKQQQRDHHPYGGFGKHIIHENSSDAGASLQIFRTPILLAISRPCYARSAVMPKYHFLRPSGNRR